MVKKNQHKYINIYSNAEEKAFSTLKKRTFAIEKHAEHQQFFQLHSNPIWQ
jgi:hypothetical protein